MKPRNLFIADGSLALVLGVAFVLLPGLGLSLLGFQGHDQGRQLLASFLGASLIANGGYQILARDLADGPAGRAFMRANLVFDLIAIVLTLIGISTGILNLLGWSLVFVFVVVGAFHLWWGFLRPVGSSGGD